MISFILSRLFCNKTTIHARYKTIIKLFGYTRTKHVKILYYASLILFPLRKYVMSQFKIQKDPNWF